MIILIYFHETFIVVFHEGLFEQFSSDVRLVSPPQVIYQLSVKHFNCITAECENPSSSFQKESKPTLVS